MSLVHRHRPPRVPSLATASQRPDRRFQMKVTLSLCLAVGGGLLAFLAPALYFLRQNYVLFDKIARDVSPSFISHLERETRWLENFLIFGFVGVLCVCFFFGLRLTRHLLGPAREVEAQLRRMTEGEWSAPVRASSHEDDTGLLDVMDYFSRSLRADTELELKILESLAIDPANRGAQLAWKNLIEMKRRKLGEPVAREASGPSEESAEVSPWRRVS